MFSTLNKTQSLQSKFINFMKKIKNKKNKINKAPFPEVVPAGVLRKSALPRGGRAGDSVM